ncbi:MAG: hypothetical protein E7497_02075 [Ruminococcus sp.]|nr:hypothetical protein [Ruminococcus sp.]
MKKAKVKTRWQRINEIILLLHIVFPVWMLFLMYTIGISGKLFLIALAAVLLLGVIYKLVMELGKGKKILCISRVVAILAIIAFYVPTLILMNFNETKLFYPLKRACYIHGVFGENYEFYDDMLPEKLLDNCSDYYFRTQGCFPAQDYHPSSYLIFHTDTEVLDLYAAHYETLDCIRLENGMQSEDEFDDIEWFCSQMRLNERVQDNLDNAVLYWFDEYYPKGMLLNYETGLVAILT